MVSARQMIAMLASLNEGDTEQLYAIALQLAATEARRGRVEVANELQNQVAIARRKNDPSSGLESRRISKVVVPITQPIGEIQKLLVTSTPTLRLSDLVLTPIVRERLQVFVNQQRERETLRSHGKVPPSRLLIMGPPGSGKTMTASALGGELHLPLHSVRLDSVITRFMGETASKLRMIFDQISSRRGVYLFDEFDAIGGKRTLDNDVGEMRRVLNSFLQFMEEPNATDSVVIAATNHPELLDEALFRRFDDLVRFKLPDLSMVETFLRDRLSPFQTTSVDWNLIAQEGVGLSQAEIAKASDEVIRDLIISRRKAVTNESLHKALGHRKRLAEAH